MPKWTGLTPKFCITGNKIGIAIRIEGAMSTRVVAEGIVCPHGAYVGP
jgi:hypothetical protein